MVSRALVRALTDGEGGLSEERRRRITLQAAERIRNRSRIGSIPASLPFTDARMSARLTLAAAAALAVVLAALPLVIDRGGPGGDSVAVPARIEMQVQNGAVRLDWSNGHRTSYTVSKSSDPRGVTGAEVHVVQGHSWTDTDPESSPIVYYRID